MLLPYGLIVMRDTDVPKAGALPIEVIGEQYWWRVRYLGEGGRPAFSTANEIVVPVGRPIAVSVTAADVIHSFWIPNFGGKIDMIPGRINRLNFTAERPGIYRGVCAEFCGDQHARMAFDVVALEPAAFEAWRENQAKPAPEPDLPLTRARARAVPQPAAAAPAMWCAARKPMGVSGRISPMWAAGRTIGAGQFPNNVGTLAGWIANTQHIKPGVRMPSYGVVHGRGSASARRLSGEPEMNAPERPNPSSAGSPSCRTRCRVRRASSRRSSGPGSRRAASASSPTSTTPMSACGTSARRFLFFLLAGILALLMRAQLAVPESDLVGHDLYNQLFTMHGTVMMFLFAVPAVEAASVYLLPNMLAARDLPFPRLSAYAFWAYFVGGLVFFGTIFFGLAPDGGWFMYPPLTSTKYSPGDQRRLVAARHRLHRDLGHRRRDRDHRRRAAHPRRRA